MNDHKVKLFETPVWGFMMAEHKYQSFNYVERLLEIEKVDLGQQKSNQGGFQTNDDLNIKEPVFRELVSAINRIANEILSDYNCLPVAITEMWGNVNRKNNFNWPHVHSGILSGVFYCKVPKDSGNLMLMNPATRSDGSLLREKNFKIAPEETALILFPSWLEHYVEPNLSDEPRISLSFNIGVK